MIRRLVLGLTLLALLGAGLLLAALFRPELFDSGLRQELSFTGATLGQSSRADLLARFGPPDQERQESLSAVLQFHEAGLLLRIDHATDRLLWCEVTGPRFATARGVRIGSTQAQVLSAYGRPSEVALLREGARLRYRFGLVYTLEFWLDRQQRVERIAFYRA